ncbi:hypothetical protein BD770DRAFT_444349 [Pilaira anomala]|nr:hypothetical protein BD770DRAFT_444349 [Pilaira anomala]
MFQLPFEILVHVFSYLSKSDLLQCQLTCKIWYESSVELLYSNLIIDRSKTSRLFVRTLVNSSRLGSNVKIVNTRELFKTKENNFWDEHGLLSALIRHCPNLLDLICWEQGSTFWTQLLIAASCGQLSRLQSLPSANSEDLESYIYTALFFKASLTRLSVKDDLFFFGLDMNRSEAYQMLQNEISEFKNLSSLSISCTSNKQLSSFDALIEDCSSLEKICIILNPTVEKRTTIKAENVFHPRPDIRQLICNWKMVDSESQLKYIIQKFPNLQHLVISNMPHQIGNTSLTNCTADAIIEFLRFIMNIPDFSMGLQIRKEDLSNLWIGLMNMDYRYRNVTIDGFSDDRYSDNVNLSIEKAFSVITFIFHNNEEDELPPTNFFTEVGSMIRSINIRDMTNPVPMVDESSIHYSTLTGIDWVFQIIELCPSLQELTIPSALGYDRSNHRTFQQTELKKLLIYNIPDSHQHSLFFLELMSMNLPNIKQLQLEYDGLFDYDINKPITILMPNTKLNLLSSTHPLSGISEVDYSIIEVYFRLHTDAGVKHYVGKRTGLVTTSEKHYNKSQEKIRFNITCRSLKEFAIIEIKHSLSYKQKWSF